MVLNGHNSVRWCAHSKVNRYSPFNWCPDSNPMDLVFTLLGIMDYGTQWLRVYTQYWQLTAECKTLPVNHIFSNLHIRYYFLKSGYREPKINSSSTWCKTSSVNVKLWQGELVTLTSILACCRLSDKQKSVNEGKKWRGIFFPFANTFLFAHLSESLEKANTSILEHQSSRIL